MIWSLLPRERETLFALAVLVAIVLPLLVLGAVITPSGCLGRVGRAALAKPPSREGMRQALQICWRNERGAQRDQEAAQSP